YWWARRGAGLGTILVVAAFARGVVRAGDEPDPPAQARSHFGEEQLLRQLAMARTLPTVGRSQAQSLLRSYQAAFEFNEQRYTEPTTLLREFPFLSVLPVR